MVPLEREVPAPANVCGISCGAERRVLGDEEHLSAFHRADVQVRRETTLQLGGTRSLPAL